MINIGIAGRIIADSPNIMQVVKTLPNCNVLFQTENGFELIKTLQRRKRIPNLIISDLDMKIIDGLGLTHFIKCHYPNLKVLIVSNYSSQKILTDLVQAGASGVILSNNLLVSIPRAIENIFKNSIYLEETNKEKILDSDHIRIKNELNKEISIQLNKKEKLFLQLTATSISYDQIADLMNIGKDSIYNYQRSIKDKLGLTTRHEFMLFAIQHGIAKVVHFNS